MFCVKGFGIVPRGKDLFDFELRTDLHKGLRKWGWQPLSEISFGFPLWSRGIPCGKRAFTAMFKASN